MRIIFDINHPADVHQFRNTIKVLQQKGHKILVTARDKDVTYELLEAYKIPYIRRKGYKGVLGKAIGLIRINHFLYKTAKKFKPDLMIGSSGNCYIAQVSKLLGKPSVVFTDTEFATIQNWLIFPFSDKICTPSCFYLDLGSKQVRYDGYKEIAYLHPDYFTPDPKVPRQIGVKKGEKYVLIRLVAFQASHDIGYSGIKNIKEHIVKLEKYCRVFISSERELHSDLKKYQLTLPPEKVHSALSYADLFIGESSTMASESAVLGTPAIFISDTTRGYIEDLIKYGLVYRYGSKNTNQALHKACEIIKKKNSRKGYQEKRKKLLKDKIDVTKWMVQYIESFDAK
ncbi:DUF354 domain-containing protein [Candidatus Woesearchaeota archaeon]|nr:DUF354 domain-containing protein [Candidatus Woesearchaeota archaeon]